jgi:hypothetical protein
MIRASVAAVATVAAIVVASASAVESTIYPGIGIGQVKLGMTKAQVERILGTEGLVDERGVVGGHAYLQVGWDYDSWTVGFLLQSGHYHAVRVGTTQYRQRTVVGVGPAAPWLKVVKAYPHGICTFGVTDKGAWVLEYLVPGKPRTQLLFTFRAVPPNVAFPDTFVVVEVVVRSRYQTWPEFAPNYEHRCREGWRSTKLPTAIH